MAHSAAHPERYRVGDLLLDVSAGTVIRDGELILLPKLSFDLLVALVRAAPGILSHERLLEQVWGEVAVSDETVKQRVKLLRATLGDDSLAPRYVAAVRGRGYRIQAEVAPAPDTGQELLGTRVTRASLRWLLLAGAAVSVAAGLMVARDRLSVPTVVSSFGPSPRLAVLPLDDLGAAADEADFAKGLHDELIARLSVIPKLRLISRTSVLPYAQQQKSIPQIGEELDADLVLEGSVRRAGNHIRMTVQLIDARGDERLWIRQYDRENTMGELLEIQTDIAQRVAGALSLVISGEGFRQLAAAPTTNLAAYDAYLMGRARLTRLTYGDLLVAVEKLERAVELDPEFADAWAALGWAYTWMGTGYGPWPPDRAYAEATRASQRALASEPSHADAVSNLATIEYWYRYDVTGFEETVRGLIAEHPEETKFVNGLAFYLSCMNRHEEAMSVVATMVSLSPHDPYILRESAWRAVAARDPDRAEAYLARALQRDQALDDVESIRAQIATLRGDLEEVAELARGGLRSWALARLGRTDEAGTYMRDYYSGFEKQGAYITPTGPAVALVGLGDIDAALEWLERGLREHAREMMFLESIPAFDVLHENPRFLDLLRRIDAIRNGGAR